MLLSLAERQAFLQGIESYILKTRWGNFVKTTCIVLITENVWMVGDLPQNLWILMLTHFFSCFRDPVASVVKGNDGAISWSTYMEIEERSLALVWLKKRKEHVSNRSSSLPVVFSQGLLVLHSTASLHISSFGQVLLCTTNDDLWLVIAHSCLLKHSVFI